MINLGDLITSSYISVLLFQIMFYRNITVILVCFGIYVMLYTTIDYWIDSSVMKWMLS